MAAADPRHDFSAGCFEQRCCYDLRTNDRHWIIWFHADEPHGLGWFDPGLSVDDDYRRIAGTWLGSREFEEMECSWSTSALSPFNRRSVFVRFIPVNGSARNREGEYCVPHRLALSGNICGTLSGPEQLAMTEPEFLAGLKLRSTAF